VVCVFAAFVIWRTRTKTQQFGPYLIEAKGDGVFVCQRLEIYLIDPAATSPKLYLGTCGTPSFITDSAHLSDAHSCFAVSDDRTAMIYFHLPHWCGGSAQAAAKHGGVYLHDARKKDDRLLYDDSHVTQVWGGSAGPSPGIKVGWISAEPHKGVTSQNSDFWISIDGTETPIW